MEFENVETIVVAETEEEAWKMLRKEHREDSDPQPAKPVVEGLAAAPD